MTLGAQDDDFGSSNLDAQIFIFYQVLGTGSSISSTVSVTGITSEYFTGAASWQGVDQASPMVNSVAAGIPMNIQMTMTLGSIGTGNLIIGFAGDDVVPQFGWGGPYISNSNHTAISGLSDNYYFASQEISNNSSNNSVTYELRDQSPILAGNLIQFQKTTPLPVELISFKTHPLEKNILLTWETASELNNDFFQIEQSKDGLNFEIIGTELGAGTTNAVQQYKHWHDYPNLGRNYYRLKQVDFDGGFEHSDIRVVAIEPESLNIAVYPNPATNNINVGIVDNTSEKNIQLFDSIGKLILQRNMTAHSNEELLEVSKLRRGIYWIKVDVDGRSFNNKILLQ